VLFALKCLFVIGCAIMFTYCSPWVLALTLSAGWQDAMQPVKTIATIIYKSWLLRISLIMNNSRKWTFFIKNGVCMCVCVCVHIKDCKLGGGHEVRGLGNKSPPVGSRAKASLGGLGDIQKLQPFCVWKHEFLKIFWAVVCRMVALTVPCGGMHRFCPIWICPWCVK